RKHSTLRRTTLSNVVDESSAKLTPSQDTPPVTESSDDGCTDGQQAPESNPTAENQESVTQEPESQATVTQESETQEQEHVDTEFSDFDGHHSRNSRSSSCSSTSSFALSHGTEPLSSPNTTQESLTETISPETS